MPMHLAKGISSDGALNLSLPELTAVPGANHFCWRSVNCFYYVLVSFQARQLSGFGTEPPDLCIVYPVPEHSDVRNDKSGGRETIIVANLVDHEQVHEFVDRLLFKPFLVETEVQNLSTTLFRKTSLRIGEELFLQQRNSFRATATVADGIFDLDPLSAAAVLKEDLNRVCDGSLISVVILTRIPPVFMNLHFVPQLIDAQITSVKIVCVVISGQVSIEQRDRDHVLQTVVAISKVCEWANLGNDADSRLVGRHVDSSDLVDAVFNDRVKSDRSFGRSLRMEFGWK